MTTYTKKVENSGENTIHRHHALNQSAMVATEDNNRPIPLDFDDDRVFYLHVDPRAIIHELPSIFYRKYKGLLRERMVVVDHNDNQIELSLGKGNSSGYIIHGFDNLVTCYGLSSGGWMKLMYVGEDVFLVVKVKDCYMDKKEFSSPYSNLATNTDALTHQSASTYSSKDLGISYPSDPTHQHQLTNQLCPQVSILQETPHYPIVTVPRNEPLNLTSDVQIVSKESYSTGDYLKNDPSKQFSEQDKVLQPAELTNESTIFQQPTISNHSQPVPLPITIGHIPSLQTNVLNKPTGLLFQPQKIDWPDLHSAPTQPSTSISHVFSCMKLLTSNQVDNSAVILPLRFAQNAFPSRHDNVNVILNNGCCYRLGLRWNKSRKIQLYLTRGWKSFAKSNGFRAGTLLKFLVSPANENTMHVQVVKL